jgi:hypothetical protein
MNGIRARPVLGVVLLDGDHVTETAGLKSPFEWMPRHDAMRGFFGDPQIWPAPTLYAVASAADGPAMLDLRPAALQGVADAIQRLEGQCDLLVGGCGFFAAAWPLLRAQPRSPALLSGLDFLDAALELTTRPVGVLTYAAATTQRILQERSAQERVRIVGLQSAGDWRHLAPQDWITRPRWTVGGLVQGLRDLMGTEATGGAFSDIGALILECTALPRFRPIIREYLNVPIFDVASVARSLLE